MGNLESEPIRGSTLSKASRSKRQDLSKLDRAFAAKSGQNISNSEGFTETRATKYCQNISRSV